MAGAKVSVKGNAPLALKYSPTVNSKGGFLQKLTTVGSYTVTASKSGYSASSVVIYVKNKTTAKTTAKTTKVTYSANEQVKLSATKIYYAATGKTVKATKSGQNYYIYKDAKVSNSRIRISTKKKGSSYGWVDISKISKINAAPQTAKPTQTTLKTFTLSCPTQVYVGDEGKCTTNTTGVKISVTSSNLNSKYKSSYTTTSSDKTKVFKYTKAGTITVTATKSGYKTITKSVTIKAKPTTNAGALGSGNYVVSAADKNVLIATVCAEDGSGYVGAKAVIDTILNRVDDKNFSSQYGKSIMKQVKAFCQFAGYRQVYMKDGKCYNKDNYPYKKHINNDGTVKGCSDAKKAVEDALANPSKRSHNYLYFQNSAYKRCESVRYGDNWYDKCQTVKK